MNEGKSVEKYGVSCGFFDLESMDGPKYRPEFIDIVEILLRIPCKYLSFAIK